MPSDEQLTFDLACASDLQLAEELLRRTLTAERRALVIGIIRPSQDDMNKDEVLLQMRGTDQRSLHRLLGSLVKACKVTGNADGTVSIPPPAPLGDDQEEPQSDG